MKLFCNIRKGFGQISVIDEKSVKSVAYRVLLKKIEK